MMLDLFLKKKRKVFSRFFCLVLLITLLPLTARESSSSKVVLPIQGIKPPQKYKKLVLPEHGAYTGAYVDFGEGEDHVSLDKILKFDKMVQKHQAIIALGSFWQRESFPLEQCRLIASYGAIPLLYWSPWDLPFDSGESHYPDRFSLQSILSGKWDHYLDTWANDAKKIPTQFFVAFGCEMNGTWFPWSGIFYTKEALAHPKKPLELYHKDDFYKEGPEVYKKAYRYVVDYLRSKGVTNILWVFHINNYSYPNGAWNLAKSYYPGSDYVDWLGMSLYGRQYQEEDWSSFAPLLEWPYQELAQLDPLKPIMLAEWGVAEPYDKKLKGAWFQEAFSIMNEERFPRLKATVVWHEKWENPDGSFSNLHINSSKNSLEAYQKGVASPYWIGFPQWDH